MTRLRLALAAAVLLLGIQVTPAKAELVTNGDFEEGNFTGWDLSLPSTNTGVLVLAPHSGLFSILSGAVDSPDFIEQTLATTPGATYRLTYWLSNLDAGAGVIPNSFQVEWDGAEVASLIDSAAFDYAEFSFTLTADDDATTLRFGFRNDPGFWALDDVSVVLVPEPGTLALFGSALLGMVGLRRRSPH